MISFGFLPAFVPWVQRTPPRPQTSFRVTLVRVATGVVLLSATLPSAHAERLRHAIRNSRLSFVGTAPSQAALVVHGVIGCRPTGMLSPARIMAALVTPGGDTCTPALIFADGLGP